MSISDETEALQQQLDELAQSSDDELLARYAMQRPPRPPALYWQMRWFAGRILRWLQSRGILHADPWPANLKHVKHIHNARPLLIWAVGADPETLRKACDGFSGLLETTPGFAPVLVTDVADFAYFSRLGWLVEYLPSLAGEGEPFEKRKARLLARLYHGAPALPLRAGMMSGSQADELRQWLMRFA